MVATLCCLVNVHHFSEESTFLHLQDALKPTTWVFIAVKVSNLKIQRVTELIVASRIENNALSHLVYPVKGSISHRILLFGRTGYLHLASHALME
jgi:hypothetical protein